MSTLAVNNITKVNGGIYPFENKNLLINGGQNVWQRSTSVTGISTQAYHTVDRWNFGGVGGGGTMRHTMARSTTVPAGQGFGYSTKIDCTTADTNLGTDGLIALTQKIEGQNLQRIKKGTASADSLTLSFWVRSNLSGASNLLTCALYDADNTRFVSATVQIASADTWQKAEVTFPPDTSGALGNDNNNSMQVDIYMGMGSQYTSGTMSTTWASYSNANLASSNTMNLASSTDNEILFTGFQLEQGTAATDFEFEPFETTQNKCFRYYRKLQKTDAGTTAGFLTTCNIGGGSFIEAAHPTMTMRTVPSISATGLVANDHSATSGDCDGVVLNSGRTNGVGVSYKLTFASGSMTAGKAGKVISNADAEFLDFSAEL